MVKKAITLKRGDGESIRVLGTGVRFLLESEMTDSRFSLMEVELPKDQGPPPHDHPWDEAYYILEGDVRFMVDGHEQIVVAGDFLYVPGDTVHSFSGASDGPARVLVFDAPATAGGFFKEASREVTVFPDDLVKVPEIGLKYGLRFLPPQ